MTLKDRGMLDNWLVLPIPNLHDSSYYRFDKTVNSLDIRAIVFYQSRSNRMPYYFSNSSLLLIDSHKTILPSQMLARNRLARYAVHNEVIAVMDRANTTILQHSFASDYLEVDLLPNVTGLIVDEEEGFGDPELVKKLYPGQNRQVVTVFDIVDDLKSDYLAVVSDELDEEVLEGEVELRHWVPIMAVFEHTIYYTFEDLLLGASPKPWDTEHFAKILNYMAEQGYVEAHPDNATKKLNRRQYLPKTLGKKFVEAIRKHLLLEELDVFTKITSEQTEELTQLKLSMMETIDEESRIIIYEKFAIKFHQFIRLDLSLGKSNRIAAAARKMLGILAQAYWLRDQGGEKEEYNLHDLTIHANAIISDFNHVITELTKKEFSSKSARRTSMGLVMDPTRMTEQQYEDYLEQAPLIQQEILDRTQEEIKEAEEENVKDYVEMAVKLAEMEDDDDEDDKPPAQRTPLQPNYEKLGVTPKGTLDADKSVIEAEARFKRAADTSKYVENMTGVSPEVASSATVVDGLIDSTIDRPNYETVSDDTIKQAVISIPPAGGSKPKIDPTLQASNKTKPSDDGTDTIPDVIPTDLTSQILTEFSIKSLKSYKNPYLIPEDKRPANLHPSDLRENESPDDVGGWVPFIDMYDYDSIHIKRDDPSKYTLDEIVLVNIIHNGVWMQQEFKNLLHLKDLQHYIEQIPLPLQVTAQDLVKHGMVEVQLLKLNWNINQALLDKTSFSLTKTASRKQAPAILKLLRDQPETFFTNKADTKRLRKLLRNKQGGKLMVNLLQLLDNYAYQEYQHFVPYIYLFSSIHLAPSIELNFIHPLVQDNYGHLLSMDVHSFIDAKLGDDHLLNIARNLASTLLVGFPSPSDQIAKQINLGEKVDETKSTSVGVQASNLVAKEDFIVATKINRSRPDVKARSKNKTRSKKSGKPSSITPAKINRSRKLRRSVKSTQETGEPGVDEQRDQSLSTDDMLEIRSIAEKHKDKNPKLLICHMLCDGLIPSLTHQNPMDIDESMINEMITKFNDVGKACNVATSLLTTKLYMVARTWEKEVNNRHLIVDAFISSRLEMMEIFRFTEEFREALRGAFY
ncbi:MAG: hypothetical protein IH840_04175 [Candidatus Heimdallarchaeota archaeon]|nr:hypothetical protein [Candidatus Heimdallarchaeota archaeon]